MDIDTPPGSPPNLSFVRELRYCATQGVPEVWDAFRLWSGAAAVGLHDSPPGAHVCANGVWVHQSDRSADQLEAVVEIVLLAVESAESHARYRALLDAGFEGVCLHEKGTLFEVNQALADLYGYSREEMLGMHVSALAAPEILPRIATVMASGWTSTYETLAVRKNGDRIPLEARGKEATWQGRPVRVAAFRDLRERKAAEADLVAAREAAEAASRTKSRFLANMSHELRTPMNGVLGMIDLLLRDSLSPQQTYRATVAKDSASHLLELLNDIIDISQVEEGRLVLRPEETAIKPLLRSALAAVEAMAHERGIELSLHMDMDTPAMWVLDPLRLRQVLVNLLGNAARHTWVGGISVDVVHNGDHLNFVVKDTGEGMTSDALAGLFDRFSSGNRRRNAPGGLGLSISQELVRMMGGEISVESALGTGTTFCFGIRATPVALVLPEEPLRIAIVHADAIERERISDCLVRRGVRVMTQRAVGPSLEAVLGKFEPQLVYVGQGEAPDVPFSLAVAPNVVAPSTATVMDAPFLVDDLVLVAIQGCQPPAPLVGEFRQLRVLVAEDNPVNQLVIEALLQRIGHTVVLVENGEEAVQHCVGTSYDLILMDIQMPVMDGLEATAMLRRKGYTGPIVALTAHALTEDLRASVESGMTGFLTKPVSVDQLVELLRSIGG